MFFESSLFAFLIQGNSSRSPTNFNPNSLAGAPPPENNEKRSLLLPFSFSFFFLSFSSSVFSISFFFFLFYQPLVISSESNTKKTPKISFLFHQSIDQLIGSIDFRKTRHTISFLPSFFFIFLHTMTNSRPTAECGNLASGGKRPAKIYTFFFSCLTCLCILSLCFVYLMIIHIVCSLNFKYYPLKTP